MGRSGIDRPADINSVRIIIIAGKQQRAMGIYLCVLVGNDIALGVWPNGTNLLLEMSKLIYVSSVCVEQNICYIYIYIYICQNCNINPNFYWSNLRVSLFNLTDKERERRTNCDHFRRERRQTPPPLATLAALLANRQQQTQKADWCGSFHHK